MLLRLAALSSYRAERILCGTLGLCRLTGTDCGKVIQLRFGQSRLYRTEAGMDTPGASSPLFIVLEITMMLNQQERAVKALEQRARRMAKSIGLTAIKSRKGVGGIANLGGFMIVNPFLNMAEAGYCFELSAEDVIAYCAEA